MAPSEVERSVRTHTYAARSCMLFVSGAWLVKGQSPSQYCSFEPSSKTVIMEFGANDIVCSSSIQENNPRQTTK